MSRSDRRRLVLALDRAAEWHGDQARKGTAAPYVSHLLQVAGLVLEHGGEGDQAVAALLHDAIEDTEATSADIARHFGDQVARMVEDASDTLPGDRPDRKSPWEERKRRHLDRLATMADDSVLVIACDKRHNLGSLVGDVRTYGLENTAERFTSDPEQWLWYYSQALGRLRDRIPARLAKELDDLLGELRALVELA